MISAAIYNPDFSPIAGDLEVSTDAEFLALEYQAQELAAAGTKCCIRWRRDSDGQVAYWGPAGASLKPHWYAKPGRPSEMEGGKAVKVYLDDESVAIAARLGSGNVSEGIRRALKQP